MQKVVHLLCRLPFIQKKVYAVLAVILFACAGVVAQDIDQTKITLPVQSVTIKSALAEVQKRGGVKFVYDQAINAYADVRVTPPKEEISVRGAIELILKKTNLRYIQVDDQIVLEEKPSGKTSVSPNLQAGQGTGGLKGRVVEHETSEPLPGASLRIAELEKGAVADNDGYYQLTGIPAGRYTLQVSFVGYATERMAVDVRDGRDETYDVKLQGDNQLAEVVITGVAKSRAPVAHATERQLVSDIKEARMIVSGISSEQISKSADRNAAQAVQRVSGVTIVDDRFVVVRGLNQRYNLTYLNDNVAPSTEVNSRAFALDLIPSRIIDKILVFKSPSPENQGDATGGVVKIYTKDAKTVKHFDVEFQLGYRQGTTFNKNFLTYNGGGTDFLGFDDGTRKLPAAVPGYGSLVRAGLTPAQYARAFSTTLTHGKKTALPNLQVTANYYNAFTLFGRKLSSLTSLSYKNDYQRAEVYRQEGAFWASTAALDRTGTDDRNINSVQTNLLQNFSYALDDRTTLTFKNFLLQQGVDATVVRTSTRTFSSNFQNASVNRDITLSYNQRFLYAGNLGGTHIIGQGGDKLTWNGGYTLSRQTTPDQRVIRLVGMTPDISMGDASLQWWARGYNPSSSEDLNTIPLQLGIVSRLWSKNSEGVYNGVIDYTYKPCAWVEVKIGTFQQWKKRDLARRVYTVHESNIDPNREFRYVIRNNYVDPNLTRFREADLARVWSANYLNNAFTGLQVLDRTSGSDMYVGTEQNNSGYAMVNLVPIRWVELSGGMRYEYNRQRIGAAIPNGSADNYSGVNRPILVDQAAGRWLPSVNVSVKPNDVWVARAAFGKTVNRTEFREVSPFQELDFENNTVVQGSPDLISATADNYDLRLEFYPRGDKGEMISIGGFYKEIADPIERINTSNRVISLFPSISYRNATSATVKGLELEIRKSFDFIPLTFFRNLSVTANASVIRSVAKFENANPNDFLVTERSLQGQAPYILNAGLYYDNAGWGSKVAVIYNYVAESIYAAGMGYKPNTFIGGAEFRGSLIELPRHLVDFSYTQRIAQTLQLKFTVQNLLDQKMQMAEDFNFSNEYEPLKEIPSTQPGISPSYEGDNIASSFRPGRFFNVSISYSF